MEDEKRQTGFDMKKFIVQRSFEAETKVKEFLNNPQLQGDEPYPLANIAKKYDLPTQTFRRHLEKMLAREEYYKAGIKLEKYGGVLFVRKK